MMPTKPAAASAADREVVITRVFDAPARLLFEAYRKPEHILQWFGPKSCPMATAEIDFRVGGRYRFAMRDAATGVVMPAFGGTYLEIIENKKIVYNNTFELAGAETMVVTISFEERNGKTTLTIHTLFGSDAMKAEHMGRGYIAGSNSALDQLAGVVAAMERA